MLKAYTNEEWKTLFPVKEFDSEGANDTVSGGSGLVTVRRASTPVNIRLNRNGEATTHYVDAGYFEIVIAASQFQYPDQGPGRDAPVHDYRHIKSLPIAIQRAIAYVESNQPLAELEAVAVTPRAAGAART